RRPRPGRRTHGLGPGEDPRPDRQRPGRDDDRRLDRRAARDRRARGGRADRGVPGPTMSAMPIALRRSEHDRVIAGVCAGIAESIGVDPTLVRLVFTLLALAGGAGIVLYAAVWLAMSGKGRIAVVVLLVAAGVALRALGLSPHVAAAPGLLARRV